MPVPPRPATPQQHVRRDGVPAVHLQVIYDYVYRLLVEVAQLNEDNARLVEDFGVSVGNCRPDHILAEPLSRRETN